MADDKLILWKPHVSEHFPNGCTPEGEVHGAGIGGHMHEDLGRLIEFLQTGENAEKIWSAARIECSQSDVESDSSLSPGWYVALSVLPSKDGFMPLEEAGRRYLNTPQ